MDGKLVVFHDQTLLRLFSHQSRIDQLTFSEVQRLSRSSSDPQSSPILLLQQMPEFLKDYSHIELEIKTCDRTNYEQLIQSLKQCLDQPDFHNLPLTLTSFDIGLLEKLQTDPVLSQYKRGLLVEPACLQLTAKLLANPALPFKNRNYSKQPLIDMENATMSTKHAFADTVFIALRLAAHRWDYFTLYLIQDLWLNVIDMGLRPPPGPLMISITLSFLLSLALITLLRIILPLFCATN